MEFSVYGSQTRNLSVLFSAIVFVPFLSLLPLISNSRQYHQLNEELLVLFSFTVLTSLIIVTGVYVSTSVRIKIDQASRKLYRINKLFGWTLYQKSYDLAEFDRVSLYRGFRQGYCASFIGKEREAVIALSQNLGTVRRTAQEAATYTHLTLKEQL